MNKQLLLVFSYILFTLSVFPQQNSSPLQSLHCKRGIYLSFNEIANNAPGYTDSFEIKERTNGSIVMVGGGNYAFELASGTKSIYKKLKKELTGISDGVNFYISDRYTVGGWQGLSLCVLSGPYIIGNIKTSAGQFTGGGLIPSMTNVGNGYLINVKAATSVAITNKLLKELLKPYPQIAKKYSVTAGLVESSVQIINDINNELKLK